VKNPWIQLTRGLVPLMRKQNQNPDYREKVDYINDRVDS